MPETEDVMTNKCDVSSEKKCNCPLNKFKTNNPNLYFTIFGGFENRKEIIDAVILTVISILALSVVFCITASIVSVIAVASFIIFFSKDKTSLISEGTEKIHSCASKIKQNLK